MKKVNAAEIHHKCGGSIEFIQVAALVKKVSSLNLLYKHSYNRFKWQIWTKLLIENLHKDDILGVVWLFDSAPQYASPVGTSLHILRSPSLKKRD